jgi:hypothetical protein
MHRVVLLALVLPIIALIVVFWLLLPGGLASMSYSPSQFSEAVQVQPGQWQGREVAVRGYVARGCPASARGAPMAACTLWLLVDQPAATALDARQAQAQGALEIAPQQESGLHAFLRRLVPGLATPFPRGIRPGRQVTLTGSLQQMRSPEGIPVFAPKGL